MKTNLLRSICLPLIIAIGMTTTAPRLAAAQGGSRLTEGFRRLDSNGDGKLSKDELSRLPRLKTRLKGADTNEDEVVSFDEFREHMVRSHQPPQPKTGKLTAGDHLCVIQVGDIERRYRVHVPTSYDAAQATPVVIAFHGGGGNPESMIRLSGLNDKSDDAGFIVVYPYGTGRQKDRSLTFNGGGCCGYAQRQKIDDVGFTRALLDDLQEAVNVDTNRVFATGISNGGIMAYYVASELSDRIAAIAPVGGPMMTDTCHPKRPVSVIHFHGTADEYAPFNGGKGKGTALVPAVLRPTFNSVGFSIQNWMRANGCDSEPKVESLPDKADDGMRVLRKTWGKGKNGSEVVLIEIEGGGHTWPGKEPPVDFLGRSTKDISANDLMWEFFQRHPMEANKPPPLKTGNVP